MKKSRHSEEQIIGVLQQMEAGRKVAEVAREVGVSEATALHLEVEVRGNGSERGAAAAGVGGRESATEATGGGPEPGPGSAESGDPKKRLELVGRREDVALAMGECGVSERRACKLLEMDRSSYRYEPQPDRNAVLRQKLIELARQKPRYGYRRLGVLLERRGCPVNHKRLYRIYCEEHLAVRRRRRQRLARPAAPVATLHQANHRSGPWIL